MLEHYALEEDPLEAFKQRQSRLEQVSPQLPSVGGGCHRQFPRLLKAEPWSSFSPLRLCDLEQLPSLSHHPSQGALVMRGELILQPALSTGGRKRQAFEIGPEALMAWGSWYFVGWGFGSGLGRGTLGHLAQGFGHGVRMTCDPLICKWG